MAEKERGTDMWIFLLSFSLAEFTEEPLPLLSHAVDKLQGVSQNLKHPPWLQKAFKSLLP